MAGLREVLEGESDDETSSPDGYGPVIDSVSSQSPSKPTSHVLFPSHRPRTALLSNVTRRILLEIYESRVDTVFKVFHWPSTLASLCEDESLQNGQDSPPKPYTTLESAIYFMSVCTLTQIECQQMLAHDKDGLIRVLREDTEAALSAAALFTTTDIATLQALTIYIVGSSRLLSMIWRLIDCSLGLGPVLPFPHLGPLSLLPLVWLRLKV